MDLLLPSLIGAILSLIVAGILGLLSFQAERKRKEQAPSLENRITSLTQSLKNSLSIISEIELEIQERSKIADKLKDDVKRYGELKELSKAQVEAIAQTIRAEITAESRKSIWFSAIITFVVALIFFFIGFFVRGG